MFLLSDSVEKILVVTPPIQPLPTAPKPPNRRQHEQKLEYLDDQIHYRDDSRRQNI